MSNYGELDPMPEHRIKDTFKGKREQVANVNMPNVAYPSQHIDIVIPHGSRDQIPFIIVSGTVKITFNLDIDSADKMPSIIVNNEGGH